MTTCYIFHRFFTPRHWVTKGSSIATRAVQCQQRANHLNPPVFFKSTLSYSCKLMVRSHRGRQRTLPRQRQRTLRHIMALTFCDVLCRASMLFAQHIVECRQLLRAVSFAYHRLCQRRSVWLIERKYINHLWRDAVLASLAVVLHLY
jgi:hypothetical protein